MSPFRNIPHAAPRSEQVEYINDVAAPSEVPSPGDHQATLAYWDNYRKNERARIAAAGTRVIEVIDSSGRITKRVVSRAALKIDDFPTTQRLAQIEQARKAAEHRALVTAAENARVPSLIERFVVWAQNIFRGV